MSLRVRGGAAATGNSGGGCRIYGISRQVVEFYGRVSATGTATGCPPPASGCFKSIAESPLREFSMRSPRCPACRSGCVRRSRRKGIVEKTLLTAAFVKPFRCVECGWRFLRPSIRRSFETEQAVFGSRMTPKYPAQPEARGGEKARMDLKLS